MKKFFGACAGLLLVGGWVALGQDRGVQPKGVPGSELQNNSRDYGALIQQVFAPITDQLNLTREQQFQIIAIITETEVSADPLVEKLDEVDQQLTELTVVDSLDESKMKSLSIQEALLLTEMITMKVRAKARIYRVLTPAQRSLVSGQLLGKGRVEGNTGIIAIN